MAKRTPAAKPASKTPRKPRAKKLSPSRAKRKGQTTPAEDAHEVVKEMLAVSEGAADQVNGQAISTAQEPKPTGRSPQLAPYRFQPGNNANPKGRPKGSRNKLGEAFISDLQADWEEHGAVAIQTVRAERPQDYLKVVASILPKQLDVRVSEYDEMNDDELDRRIRQLAAFLEIGTREAPGRTQTAH